MGSLGRAEKRGATVPGAIAKQEPALPPIRQAVALIKAGRTAKLTPAYIQYLIRRDFPSISLVAAYAAVCEREARR